MSRRKPEKAELQRIKGQIPVVSRPPRGAPISQQVAFAESKVLLAVLNKMIAAVDSAPSRDVTIQLEVNASVDEGISSSFFEIDGVMFLCP